MIKQAKTILGEWWMRCDHCFGLIEVYETKKECMDSIKECIGYNKKTRKVICLDCYQQGVRL